MTVLPMPCERCGLPGYAAGAELLCATHGGVPDAAAVEAIVTANGTSPLRQAAPLWPLVTVTFAAAGAAHAALQAVSIRALQRADTAIDKLATLPRTEAADTLRFAADIGSLARTGLWAYLTFFLLWLLLTGATATRRGLDKRATLRHWTILVWRVALVPTLVFSILAGHPDPTTWQAAHAANQNAIAFAVFHILTTTLLMTYTVIVWRRLRPTPPDPL